MGKTTFITIYQLSCFVGHPVFKLTKINENDGSIKITKIGLKRNKRPRLNIRGATNETSTNWINLAWLENQFPRIAGRS